MWARTKCDRWGAGHCGPPSDVFESRRTDCHDRLTSRLGWQCRRSVALSNVSASPMTIRRRAGRQLLRARSSGSSLVRRSVALDAEVRRPQPAVEIARPRNRMSHSITRDASPVGPNMVALRSVAAQGLDLLWRAARPMSVARFLTWASLLCRPSGRASHRFRTSE
jgi:hypothetical protein